MAIEFKIVESEKIKDLFVIEPTINEDIRGNIWTSFIKGDRIAPSSKYQFQP